MTTFTLNEQMITGITPVDEQHQQFINSFEQLRQNLNSSDKTLLTKQFEQLIYVMRFNFSFKQILMLYTEYPDTQTYINIQTRLLKQVDTFYQKFINGKNNAVADCIKFLDTRFKTYLPLEINTYVPYCNDFFAKLQEEQKNEYLQNINDQLQGLNAAQMDLRLTELFEAYDLA